MDQHGGWLRGISEVFEKTRLEKEAARKQAELERGEPALFVPDDDPENAAKGFGVGYWVCGDEIYGIRKHSNGYERYASEVYEKQFLEKMLSLMNKK